MGDASQTKELETLAAGAPLAGSRAAPPVHLWNPARCGTIDIVIRRGGAWVHEGTPIGRTALVRLFSTVLRRDLDGYHLVTPVEKLKIEVEDAPFVAVGLEARNRGGEDQTLCFTTNVGDTVEAGPENPIHVEVRAATGEPSPYVHVRRGLEALIARAVFYELVELAIERPTADGAGLFVFSRGAAFLLGPTRDRRS